MSMSHAVDPINELFNLISEEIKQLDPQLQPNRIAQLAKECAHFDTPLAMKLADTILRESAKSRAVSDVALSMAHHDMDAALTALSSCHDHHKDRALSEFVHINGNSQKPALSEILKSIQEENLRSRLSCTSTAKSSEWESALIEARKLKDLRSRAVTLAHIARWHQDLGLEVEAVETAAKIKNANQKAITLSELASILQDNYPLSGELIEQALYTAETIKSKWNRSETLYEIISLISEFNTPQSLFIAARIENEYFSSLAYCDIIAVLSQSDFKQALTLARAIPQIGLRPRALSCAALKVADKDPERSRRLLQEALDIAEDLKDGFWRSNAMGEVASAWSEINEQEAKDLFLPLIEVYKDPEERLSILMGMMKGIGKKQANDIRTAKMPSPRNLS